MVLQGSKRFPSTLRHHQSLLAVMAEFVDVEFLTDVTLTSAEGTELNAHRKILAQVSPIIRKFAAIMPHDQRINICLPVILHFEASLSKWRALLLRRPLLYLLANPHILVKTIGLGTTLLVNDFHESQDLLDTRDHVL